MFCCLIPLIREPTCVDLYGYVLKTIMKISIIYLYCCFRLQLATHKRFSQCSCANNCTCTIVIWKYRCAYYQKTTVLRILRQIYVRGRIFSVVSPFLMNNKRLGNKTTPIRSCNRLSVEKIFQYFRSKLYFARYRNVLITIARKSLLVRVEWKQ